MEKVFKYKKIFATNVHAISPTDENIKESKASLTELKKLLPADIDPNDDPALLFIAGNLFVGGLVNLNDDGVDIESAVKIHKKFEKQQINIEHGRNRIVGYILHAGLTEFGTDKPITEDEARKENKPFNVSIIAVLWRAANRELCNFIEEISEPTHPNFKDLSLSFEVGYTSFNIALIPNGSRIITDARKIITPSDPEFEEFAQKLRTFGGSGKDGQDNVFQLLSGRIIPLGGGIVASPAAAVKGLISLTDDNEREENIPEDTEIDEVAKEEAVISKAKAACFFEADRLTLLGIFKTLLIKSCVSKDTVDANLTNMKDIKKLTELKEKIASAKTVEQFTEAFAGISTVIEAITQESERLQDQLETEKNRSAEIEKNKKSADDAMATLQTQYDSLKKELDELKEKQAAEAAERAFQAHMSAIDEEFALSDDERSLIVDEVKVLNQEAFAAWLKKAKVMMKEKTKAFRQELIEKEKAAREKLAAAIKNKKIEELDESDQIFKDAIASAQQNNVSEQITNTTTDTAKTLAEQIKQEFEENVSIGGRKLKDFNKKN